MEFTPPDTQQQNGRVEQTFVTLYGRVKGILNASNLPKFKRNKLWAKCARSAKYAKKLSVKVGKDVESQEEVLTAESAAQSGRDMARFGMEEMTIDQVFSNDYAFFVQDAIMENVDPEKMEEPVKSDREMELFNEVKNSKTHLVDLLDSTIRNDERLAELDRLIKHIVWKLKEEVPENFQDAYNHPDGKIRAKWRAGICKEFLDMIARGVW